MADTEWYERHLSPLCKRGLQHQLHRSPALSVDPLFA